MTYPHPPIKENWLSPANKLLIQQAVRRKNKEVTLRGGLQLKLTYEKGQAGKTYAGDDMVDIRAVGKFVPRGKFRIATILDLMWLAFAGDKKEM